MEDHQNRSPKNSGETDGGEDERVVKFDGRCKLLAQFAASMPMSSPTSRCEREVAQVACAHYIVAGARWRVACALFYRLKDEGR